MSTNIAFLGTPPFVQPIKQVLAEHFTLVVSLKEADLGIVAAFGKILTPAELNAPKYGFINIHPSLLPKYRGPSPIQAAILNGDKTSGITIIKMDEEVDHGPIIYQEQLELSDSDNFDTLSKKMFLRASDVLPQVIKDLVEGKIKPRLQDNARATHCNLLTRESGYFDISTSPSPEILDRMIRAYYPWPGVWTKWKNKIVKFLPLTRHPERSRWYSPSWILDECNSSGLVKDLSTSLSPTSVGDSSSQTPQNDKLLIQMEGKKVLSLKDFLNGYPNFPLKTLLG